MSLNDYVLQLGQRFAAAAHQPRAVSKSLVPDDIRYLFHAEGNNVILNGQTKMSYSSLCLTE